MSVVTLAPCKSYFYCLWSIYLSVCGLSVCVWSADIATAIAPYQATGPEQLSLQAGQLIDVRKKNPSGWWEGELQVCSNSYHFSACFLITRVYRFVIV